MSTWDEFTPSLGEQVADDLRTMVLEQDADAPRSQQKGLGPSEIGDPCTRCLAEKILGIEQDQGDPWMRIIGTAVHGWLEEAALGWNIRHTDPRWTTEWRVFPDAELLPAGGSCDLYDDQRHMVIDHKVVGQSSIRKYKANGIGERYRNQIQLYGLGYTNKGHRVDTVAVAFWMRGGTVRDLWVHTEPYDQTIAQACLDRYRTLRDLVTPIGPAILPNLPTDPDCWTCGRRQATAA